ncbi:uracil-DNA glycosylase [Catenovulum maritimum]|uniref:Uracil-DNA glycosylase n=1 Tax=Catenovulum maritimum TaxID=1513271 RepID=A0A0J8JPS1_9ALTE|nr:uracil-DNA glycosylase [Catenovulum maritimum]KMT66666.1 uracil-DNA glycosylase [Catenovulum maritimum]
MSWQSFFDSQNEQDYFKAALAKVAADRAQGKLVFPADKLVFSAFDSTPLEKVKVVILGQDPYHGEGQAHGLCFSVLPEVKIPPSLKNIYKELAIDISGFNIPEHGYLQSWAEQGVLLLNTVLTVEQGKAHSHAKYGWEKFTDAAIEYLSQTQTGVVFLLWGAHAQKKAALIDSSKHHILTSVHPSPLSAHRGFLGCKHFSQANQLLEKQGKTEINWCLDSLNGQFSLI